MKQKFNTNFRLERRKGKLTDEIIQKNVPIILDFTFDGKRLQYFSGYRIDFSKWDTATQRVRRNNFNDDQVSAQTINDHLTNIEKHASDIFKEAKTLNSNPTPYTIGKSTMIEPTIPATFKAKFEWRTGVKQAGFSNQAHIVLFLKIK